MFPAGGVLGEWESLRRGDFRGNLDFCACSDISAERKSFARVQTFLNGAGERKTSGGAFFKAELCSQPRQKPLHFLAEVAHGFKPIVRTA